MKICLISREYPPGNHIGGIGTYAAAAAALLNENGHEIHVITHGMEPSQDEENGIRVHRTAMLPHPLPSAPWMYYYRHWYRRLLPVYLDSLTWAMTAADSLSRLACTESFDAVEYPETMGEGAFLEVSDSCRKICRIHFSPLAAIAPGSLEKYLVRKLERRGCRAARRIVAPSEYIIRDYAVRALHISHGVELNRNPISLWAEKVDWPEKRINQFLFAGRIEYRKGINTLIDAMETAAANHPGSLHLKIAGSAFTPRNRKDRETQDRFFKFVKTYSAKAGSDPKKLQVEFLGAVPHSRLCRLYDWAGVFLLPSYEENYPYVALEALSRGCHVIGSNTGGIPEIIDHPFKGTLFKTGDKAGMARNIESVLLNHDIILGRMKDVSSQIRETFSRKNCYERLIPTYGPVS